MLQEGCLHKGGLGNNGPGHTPTSLVDAFLAFADSNFLHGIQMLPEGPTSWFDP